MKKILTTMVMCLILVVATTEISFAQPDAKKEKKEGKGKKEKAVKAPSEKAAAKIAAKALQADAKAWKKKLKKFPPLELKALVDDAKELQNAVTEAESNLSEDRKKLIAKDEEINELQAEAKKLKETTSAGASFDATKGIVFKVQIGAYEGIDITDQATSETDLGAEKTGNVKKYTLGAFKDYWSADKFKKYIRAMGLKDAWIVAYKDGKRVDVKTVLKEVI